MSLDETGGVRGGVRGVTRSYATHEGLGTPADRPAPAEGDRLLPPGTVLGGSLEVRGLLGEGGMGQVYEAHDRALNRRVAVKIGWPGQEARVLTEAQAMAAIRHPGVVTIHSIGRHADTDYAVMELVRGHSLEELLDRRRAVGSPLPVDDAIGLLAGMAGGLGAVHGAGMAHRDVKPTNVLLAPGDRVVLTDFGIFRAEIQPSDPRVVDGSPFYMAPETIRGNVRPGEAYLVDTYALGVVAFELLTNEVPFSSENVRKVFWMHLTQEPPPLSLRRADAPARLVDLVAEMLSKDPRSRPQSMDEVSWRLRHVASRAPRPPSEPHALAPPRRPVSEAPAPPLRVASPYTFVSPRAGGR